MKSYLELNGVLADEKRRLVVITNYIAFSVVILGLIILLVDSLENPENFPDFKIESFGALFLLLSGVFGLLFNRFGWFTLSRVVISILPITLLQLFPLIVGNIVDEFYYWYPYGVVAASVIPQVVFSFNKEKVFYTVCLLYIFLYIVFIDNILIYYANDQVTILESIFEHRLFYGLAPIFAFLFTTSAISYLKYINGKFQVQLLEANLELSSTVEELQTTQQHLVQSEKMASLGTLTAGVAHEINNPLNFIAGGVNIIHEIKEELNPEKSPKILEKCEIADKMVTEGLERATQIVKSLMAFSYRGEPVLVETNLNELIDNTLLFLSLQLEDDILVTKDYLLTDNVPVYQEKIHQVIQSILDNALFELRNQNSKEKRISIVTDKIDSMARIRILNSGDPISPVIISQIFDPFFTTKDPGVGIGLGLSISYNFIKAHKGRIFAENLGDETCITIELPLE